MSESISEDNCESTNLTESDYKIELNEYVVGSTIGEGTFAKVKIAEHRLTGEKVAIKIFKKSQMQDDDYQNVKNEIEILKRLKHRNIVQIYDVKETQEFILIIMELAEGADLFEYISNRTKLDEYTACSLFQQIISAVEYIHLFNVAHRDIKPENILLDFNQNIKISDFGLSKIYTDDRLLTTPCGSPNFAPPEMMRGEEYHGLFSDVWSLGVNLYAMLCGYLPFPEEDEKILAVQVAKGEIEIPDFLSDEAIDLLQNMLQVDPCVRYDFEQIKSHPWFNLISYYDIPGLNMGVGIPVDFKIINIMTDNEKERVKIVESVVGNEVNIYTTNYYLNVRKVVKRGGKSVSDFYSDEFIRYLQYNVTLNSENVKIQEEIPENRNDNNDEIERQEIINGHNQNFRNSMFQDEISLKNHDLFKNSEYDSEYQSIDGLRRKHSVDSLGLALKNRKNFLRKPLINRYGQSFTLVKQKFELVNILDKTDLIFKRTDSNSNLFLNLIENKMKECEVFEKRDELFEEYMRRKNTIESHARRSIKMKRPKKNENDLQVFPDELSNIAADTPKKSLHSVSDSPKFLKNFSKNNYESYSLSKSFQHIKMKQNEFYQKIVGQRLNLQKNRTIKTKRDEREIIEHIEKFRVSHVRKVTHNINFITNEHNSDMKNRKRSNSHFKQTNIDLDYFELTFNISHEDSKDYKNKQEDSGKKYFSKTHSNDLSVKQENSIGSSSNETFKYKYDLENPAKIEDNNNFQEKNKQEFFAEHKN